mmetsp:Transcript_27334/g.38144  ORF Transcript_27334/g.38144 Transcript_27334/m.38144 type:complete len:122 (+) Transcript_27334:115-480(+)|eukprot:CAMPEP_0185251038 /NCGR_PEP_ID=MMETSP1359-20130426/258_1 /TAXON_ID=552665 /ORGANISM="Bigelowiella longifila, Strain CCMP242" /LENGTH=121 /DNA_ID=CAMNT_0027832729 /DNA_START=72 /DNA_END=437 /DNA_ORIENTATION=+
MELANFAPARTNWSRKLLIASVFINVALVLALCFLSFGAEQGLAAPVRNMRSVAPMPKVMSKRAFMKGGMAGMAGAFAGAAGKARADTDGLKDKSVAKICSSNPTASVCVKPGGIKAAAKR